MEVAPPLGTSRRLDVGLVALLAIVLYAITLDVPWYFDDYGVILGNPAVRDLSASLRGALVPRGLGLLTFALNYRLGGIDPAGYHAVNLAIHLLAGITVYLLLLRVFAGARSAALAGAALFVAHPLQTQAVTYAVQRLASLCALLFLLSLLCWVKSREAGREGAPSRAARAGWLAGSVALGAAALLTKENAVVLPLGIGLFDRFFLPRDRSRRRELLELSPFVVLSVAAVIGGAVLPLLRSADLVALTHAQQAPTPLQYFATELRVLWLYLRLLVLPLGQALDYDTPVVRDVLSPGTALGLAGLAALVLAAWALRRRSPPAAFGIAWFLVTLSVESSFIPLDPVFEHRLYLPMLGFAAVFVAAVRAIPRRRVAAAAAATAIAACGGLTLRRNALWRDPVAFLEDNARRAPLQSRVRLALGIVHLERKRPRDAIAELEAALRLDPRPSKPHSNLGRAYAMLGDAARAEAHHRASIAIDPTCALELAFLGEARAAQDDWADAEASHRRALALDPSCARAHLGLALALHRRGRHPEAHAEIRESLRLEPFDPEAWYHAGRMSLADGDVSGAASALARLGDLDRALAGRLDAQLRAAQQAIRRRPSR